MFVAIRRFKVQSGSIEEEIRRVENGLVHIPVLATWNIRSEKANVRAIEPAFTGCKKICSRGKF